MLLLDWAATGGAAERGTLATGENRYAEDMVADGSGNIDAAVGEDPATIFLVPAGESTPSAQIALEPASVRLAVDGNNDVYALGQLFQQRSYVAKIAGIGGPVQLTITDSQNRPVQALKNQNGWPLLNADDVGALANPVTVTLTLQNPDQTSLQATATLILNDDPQQVRFNVFAVPQPVEPRSCSEPIVEQLNNNPASLLRYQMSCDILLQPGETRTLRWQVWIQPSAAGTLTAQASLTAGNTSSQTVQKTVQVPQAQIKPVVVMSGFLGSFWQWTTSGRKWVLDPLQGTYQGLLDELALLGYEQDSTIVPFAYPWFGESMANPNDMANVADDLNTTMTSWWTTRPQPAYVDGSSFDFVTHSTGGIILRQYVAAYGGAQVGTVFMVAVPNQGTPATYASLEGLDPQMNNPWFNAAARDIFDALATKAGCYQLTSSGVGAIPAVNDANLYTYLHGKNCITTSYPLGAQQIDNGPQPGVPLMRQLLPSGDSQESSNYFIRNGAAEAGPTSIDLATLNRSADAFVRAVTDDGGHRFSMFSRNIRTVNQYDVMRDDSTAPLWLNGTAKPKEWEEGIVLPPSGYKRPPVGDDTVPNWSADLQKLVSADLQSKVETLVVEDLLRPDPPIGHVTYFNRLETLRLVAARLVDPTANAAFIANLPLITSVAAPSQFDAGMALLVNYCPVTMLITDPQGRRIGTTPDGRDVNEIPGGFYTGHDRGMAPTCSGSRQAPACTP